MNGWAQLGDRRLVEFRALVDQLSALDRPPAPAVEHPVPVTVVTGPLGSGKTTLLRRLLRGDHGLRLAVVVNDLAAIDIDGRLLADVAEDRIELTNGCSCCSLVGDVVDALEALATRGGAGQAPAEADRRRTAPDAIVIETSGVSDPVALCQAVLELGSCRLDGVLTVVDAPRAFDLLADPLLGAIVSRQLQAATAIVMSKPDLVDIDQQQAAFRLLAERAPGRPVVPVIDGDLDPAIALDGARHGVGLDRASRPLESPGHGVSSRVVELADRWPMGELISWLDDPERPPLLRAKGTVVTEDEGVRLLQLVGSRWSLDPAPPGLGRNDDRTGDGRLVLLGTDEEELERAAAFLECGPSGR